MDGLSSSRKRKRIPAACPESLTHDLATPRPVAFALRRSSLLSLMRHDRANYPGKTAKILGHVGEQPHPRGRAKIRRSANGLTSPDRPVKMAGLGGL